MVLTSVGVAGTLGQHNVVLLLPLIPRDTIRDVVGLNTVPQQQLQSKMLSEACANYAMGPPQVSFLLQSGASYHIPYIGVCYIVCFLLSGSNVAAIFFIGDSTISLQNCNPSEYIHDRHMCILVLVHGPCLECTE